MLGRSVASVRSSAPALARAFAYSWMRFCCTEELEVLLGEVIFQLERLVGIENVVSPGLNQLLHLLVVFLELRTIRIRVERIWVW